MSRCGTDQGNRCRGFEFEQVLGCDRKAVPKGDQVWSVQEAVRMHPHLTCAANTQSQSVPGMYLNTCLSDYMNAPWTSLTVGWL
jgi:hypothetical protein